MKRTKEDIEQLIKKICFDYDTARYLKMTGLPNCIPIKGSKLWNLWYAIDRLSVNTINLEQYKCYAGECTLEEFYSRLQQLDREFEIEFNKVDENWRTF